MKLIKRYLLLAVLIAIASQVSISVFEADFRITAGIIIFALSLFLYPNLKPIPLGLISGLAVYASRLLVYYLGNGTLRDVWLSYQFEILFYLFYSLLYVGLRRRQEQYNLNKLAIHLFICDVGANLIEFFSRLMLTPTHANSELSLSVAGTLLFVALIRSALIWVVLTGLKHYKNLLLKEEHEVRYARLVWLTAQLKSEMYWMEKNMDEIEKVMTNAYKLFENIKFIQRQEDWGEQAVTIARDVHEIKKEYALAVRGIKDLTMSEMVEGGMEFKDICRILKDAMKRELQSFETEIGLTIETGENFYTSKHYFLMSILRNLIMNSMDAIETGEKTGKIELIHKAGDTHHHFIVSDTGSGIDPQDLAAIFTPGFSTKINYETGHINRGLGLSVVQNIVEKELNGEIGVTSVKGQGTTFDIAIPKADLGDAE
ncbi:ATP-binding protein [Acidaminobacter hydrogenoformans]|uniref:histidine kinase n=1 Tax=Acidaminobacter hydrogenoformans DSM 2784 TaxID=1120920 RepID=A0A1G5RXE4_9FIRM|nr:ATP-binding protein [Acidaminobacter hydrogenoformans]SCZ78713.1 two-component system, sensor histidine kinase YcbA [Acidaminobacter hydrogenoformans DSM 2784]